MKNSFYEDVAQHFPRARNALKKSDNNLPHAVFYLMHNKNLDNDNPVVAMAMEYTRPDFLANAGDFSQQPRVQEFLAFLSSLPNIHDDPRVNEWEVRSKIQTLWHLLAFEDAGKRIYDVTPGAGQRFLLTSLRGLQTKDILLPYPTINIRIPPQLGLNDGATTEAFLTESVDPVNGRGWCVSTINPNDLSYSYVFMFMPMTLGLSVLENEGAWKKLMVSKDLLDLGTSGVTEKTDAVEEAWLAFFHWLQNLVFYVIHPDADLRDVEMNKDLETINRRLVKARGGKAKKLREHARCQISQTHILVGPKMKLNTTMPTTAGEARGSLIVRSYVPGHYQRYHTRAGVVWKFKDAFWRGPEDGELGPSTHRIQ